MSIARGKGWEDGRRRERCNHLLVLIIIPQQNHLVSVDDVAFHLMYEWEDVLVWESGWRLIWCGVQADIYRVKVDRVGKRMSAIYLTHVWIYRPSHIVLWASASLIGTASTWCINVPAIGLTPYASATCFTAAVTCSLLVLLVMPGYYDAVTFERVWVDFERAQ